MVSLEDFVVTAPPQTLHQELAVTAGAHSGESILLPTGRAGRMLFSPDVEAPDGALNKDDLVIGETLELLAWTRRLILRERVTGHIVMVYCDSELADRPRQILNTSVTKLLASLAVYSSFCSHISAAHDHPTIDQPTFYRILDTLTKDGRRALAAIDPDAGDATTGYWPHLLHDLGRIY